MGKRTLDPKTYLYPMPVTLVGVMAEGKPNFLAISYCGIVNHEPPIIAIGVNKDHYSAAAIEETNAFSINIPTETQLKAADYCGIVSGRDIDKGSLFTTFLGDYEEAPMIEECPLCMECSVLESLDYGGTNMVFIGEILRAYADEDIMDGDLPDIVKLNPIMLAMHQNEYFKIGNKIGKAWSEGKDYSAEK